MQRIVVAAKAGQEQPWVADAAADLATQTGAAVAVISVDGVELEALAPMPRSEYTAAARRSAEDVAARLRSKGVEPTVEVRSGKVVTGILVFAEEQEADLLVVGTSTRSAVARRLLGDVALELVHRSRRPVLMVSPTGAGGA
jgi:nucleotide-binding universal stress UspA family protein